MIINILPLDLHRKLLYPSAFEKEEQGKWFIAGSGSENNVRG